MWCGHTQVPCSLVFQAVVLKRKNTRLKLIIAAIIVAVVLAILVVIAILLGVLIPRARGSN